MADAQPVAELDDPARLEPDERRDSRVRALLAEQGLLEARVRAVEGLVVPVEAAARLGDVGEQRQQDGAEQARARRGPPRMSARVDRRGRLAAERLERDHGVAEPEQPAAARLDEGTNERPVLVKRRPVARAVLLEHELDLGAVLDLAAEEGEGAEAEAAQGRVEMRSAHAPGYVPPGPSPFSAYAEGARRKSERRRRAARTLISRAGRIRSGTRGTSTRSGSRRPGRAT